MKQFRLNLAHPVLIYTVIWLAVIFLIHLQLTTQLSPLRFSTLLLVVGNIFSFWIIYFVLKMFFHPAASLSIDQFPEPLLNRLKRFVKIILVIWALGTLVEIVYARGVPIFWALRQGFDKNYTDFGIPTFHGLLNSLYLLSVTTLFLSYLINKKLKTLAFILLLLGWPIIMLGRGILLGALCQMCGIYFIFKRISLRRLLAFSLLVLLIIWAFGAIGDIRGTPNPFANLVQDQYQETFQKLPSGYLWFYVYITSPLCNINSNIDEVVPIYTPHYSIAGLFPTVARDFLLTTDDQKKDALYLVNEGLNVSTFYAGFLLDFGMAGCFIIVAMLQVICVFVYFFAKCGRVWAIVAYAVLFQCIVFSIFFNLFFLQTYIFQIIVAWLVLGRVQRSAITNENC